MPLTGSRSDPLDVHAVDSAVATTLRIGQHGAVADPAFTRFPFPLQRHFDVLRGLEHFAAVGAEPDEWLAYAVDVLRRKRRRDGRWPVQRGHPGRYWYRLEEPGPSRWATLRCLRVLRW